jgi:D-alanyl-D-alanine carboxypeptidase/D-alanyl-D-alanine-endopeptidase (penicillin-binding protein 4)
VNRLLSIVLALASLPAAAKPSRDALASLRVLEKAGARVGAVFMVGGREVAALHADQRLNPASVTKVFTAALAIDRLGAERKLVTTVALAGGEGDQALRVTGSGDPSLVSADLADLARCVREAGVTSASRLVVDPGPFTRDTVPPAYDRKQGDAAYRAGVAGFQVDLNAIQVTVRPGKPGAAAEVDVAPRSDWVRVENSAVTSGPQVKKRKRLAITTVQEDGRLVVRVTGTFRGKEPYATFRRVPDPAAGAAWAMTAALRAAGVEVAGEPRAGSTPADAKVLCRHESAPLADVLKPMLKESLNPIAESLLRLAGARDSSGPVGFGEGVDALAAFLKDRVGLKPDAFRFANGSGLYDANEVSPRAVARLLRYVRETAAMAAVIDALPVAGADGTLKKRFIKTPLSGKVRAKTGTLDDVVSLAGYADLPDGRVLEFAVMIGAGKGGTLDTDRARKAIDAAVLGVWKAL